MASTQSFLGTVLSTQMTMKVQLDTGKVVTIPGNAPKGSRLQLQAIDVLADAHLLGYAGHSIVSRGNGVAPQLSASADARTQRPLAVYGD